MSDKVRIHDLAKKYGMPGKDLAAKLRDFGFSQARSHMSSLDTFEVMQAEGILGANGIVPVNGGEEAIDSEIGGLKIKKKKKKRAADAEAPRSGPEPSPIVDEAPPTGLDFTDVESNEDEGRSEPAVTDAVEDAHAGAATGEPEDGEPSDSQPEQELATGEPGTDSPVAGVPEPGAEDPSAQTEEAATDENPEGTAEKDPGEEALAPSPSDEGGGNEAESEDSAKPKGTVVGFIDPTNFQANEVRRRPESRKLQSRDLVTIHENLRPEIEDQIRGKLF